MKPDALIAALQGYVGIQLTTDLVTDYLKVRQDYATRTLERAMREVYRNLCAVF